MAESYSRNDPLTGSASNTMHRKVRVGEAGEDRTADYQAEIEKLRTDCFRCDRRGCRPAPRPHHGTQVGGQEKARSFIGPGQNAGQSNRPKQEPGCRRVRCSPIVLYSRLSDLIEAFRVPV